MTKIFVGQPLSVSLISGIEKVRTRDWGEGKYQDFPSKVFCLTVTKNSVGQPLNVSLISGIEKFYASEVMSRFSVQNILSHSDEKFRWATLKCVINFGYRKILCFRGYVTFFCPNYFV